MLKKYIALKLPFLFLMGISWDVSLEQSRDILSLQSLRWKIEVESLILF